jgi:3-methyladenine DNA glycosylase AlkC
MTKGEISFQPLVLGGNPTKFKKKKMPATETTTSEIKRKGARSIKEIPHEILIQLNEGSLETANLVEWLAIDQKGLLQFVLQQSGRGDYYSAINNQIDALKKQTINTRNEAIGKGLLAETKRNNDPDFLAELANHTSDSVRCWAGYAIGFNIDLDFEQKAKAIKKFASDHHFGVREISWMALRPDLVENLETGLKILTPWALDKDESIRRFASEVTRPRGVWCAHIETLKKQPELGLSILEPLKSDGSRYVQNSVANWLNDAGKTQPDFVKTLCQRWNLESDTKETSYIVKRAMRSF